jgi:hypothetical protein
MMLRPLYYLTLFALSCLWTLPLWGQPPEGVRVQKIWNRAPHNAFTDLARWNDDFYCTFREGTGHVPGKNGKDGTIRLLRSTDGEQWESTALMKKEGFDLRDPKLSVTPEGHLMILMGGSNYDGTRLVDRRPMVAFMKSPSSEVTSCTPLKIDPAISQSNDWLWRVTWHQGTGYGVVYQPGDAPWGLHLVKTDDGIHYRKVRTFDLPGRPNESTIRFGRDDTMWLVVRNEDDKSRGHLGRCDPPYENGWEWEEIDRRLGGPDFIRLPGGTWILGTRSYKKGGPKTTIGQLATNGDFTPLFDLPSGGDTSYPGFLVAGDELWMSYYSSHEEKTAIYLAKIPLELLP